MYGGGGDFLVVSLNFHSKEQIDINLMLKMIIFKDFLKGCHDNKEGSILTTLISKSHLFMLGKSPKISRKNPFPFQRYLPKTIKEGEIINS